LKQWSVILPTEEEIIAKCQNLVPKNTAKESKADTNLHREYLIG
jgi:hypothetical protein